jgi:acetolactate decarboxylase
VNIVQRLVLILLLFLTFAPHNLHAEGRRVFFQYSTIQALMAGVYDGDLTFRELAEQGDFGLGTLNGLDGEMIGVDGKFYQVKANGVANPVPKTAKTPFANVTWFHPDTTINVNDPVSLQDLEQYLRKLLPSPNLIYAIKITGTFPFIKTRSVSRQLRPYPLLTEAVKKQTVFEFYQVSGVIVGFWTPSYLAGVNVAGYHLHFITADRRAGGHLLNCCLEQARIEISRMAEFKLQLPRSGEFLQKDLMGAGEKEIGRIEK